MGGTINEAIPFRYYSGEADRTVSYYIVDESNNVATVATMTEVGSIGFYRGTFTPDTAGVWTVAVIDGTLAFSKEYHIDMGQEDDMKGSGWSASTDTLEAIRNALDVVDAFHDVPTKDSTDDAQMSDVIGKKEDTARTVDGPTRSLVSYAKGSLDLQIAATADEVTTTNVKHSIGNKADAASQDADATTKSIIALVKGILDVLYDADGIASFPSAAAPGDGISVAEVLRSVYNDTNELQTDWADGGRLDLLLDLVALASVLGALTDAAVQDGDATTATVQSLVKGLHDVLWDADGVASWAAGAAPGDGVSLSEAIRKIYDDLVIVDGYHDVATADAATNAQMSDVIGNKTDAPEQDADATEKSLIALVKGLHDLIWDDAGVAAWPAAAAPANGVSLAEAIRYIYSEQFGTEFDGSPDLYDVLVTGYDSSGASLDIDGGVHEILKALAGSGWTSETMKATYDLADAILDLTETGDTLTADGSEQNVYISDSPSGVFEPRTLFIDVTNMAANDTITIREYYRLKSGGNYICVDGKDLADAQPAYNKGRIIDLRPNRYGVKVTLEQTAGVNRDYDWEVFYSG